LFTSVTRLAACAIVAASVLKAPEVIWRPLSGELFGP
jgi:hypothetical protein